MPERKTPGVYVEEISVLPASVVSVATAVPAFIGHTENHLALGGVNGTSSSNPKVVVRKVQSLLDYENTFGVADASDVSLTQAAPFAAWSPTALRYRMYYSLVHYFMNGGGPCYVASVGDYSDLSNAKDGALAGLLALKLEDEPTMYVFVDGMDAVSYNVVLGQACTDCVDLRDRIFLADVPDPTQLPVRNASLVDPSYGVAYTPNLVTSISPRVKQAHLVTAATIAGTMTVDYGVLNQMTAALSAMRVELPPCPGVAGAMVRNDNSKGVASPPANILVLGVERVSVRITDAMQDDLNVDPVGGKSINVLRAFTGRGVMIWGARTLDGNSNEWRYVNVRRFVTMVEESIQKAVAAYVFEPNTAETWQTIKSMIESFLNDQWRDGALAGATPEKSYFVQCGLGSTMTAADILNGYLRVQVGLAVVRPAEFITLQFQHQMPVQ